MSEQERTDLGRIGAPQFSNTPAPFTKDRLTRQKSARMDRAARRPPRAVTQGYLDELARTLGDLEAPLARLRQEDPS